MATLDLTQMREDIDALRDSTDSQIATLNNTITSSVKTISDKADKAARDAKNAATSAAAAQGSASSASESLSAMESRVSGIEGSINNINGTVGNLSNSVSSASSTANTAKTTADTALSKANSITPTNFNFGNTTASSEIKRVVTTNGDYAREEASRFFTVKNLYPYDNSFYIDVAIPITSSFEYTVCQTATVTCGTGLWNASVIGVDYASKQVNIRVVSSRNYTNPTGITVCLIVSGKKSA